MKVYKVNKDNHNILLVPLPKSNGRYQGITFKYNDWQDLYDYQSTKTYTESALEKLICVGDTNNDYILDLGTSKFSATLRHSQPVVSHDSGRTYVPISPVNIRIVSDGAVPYMTINDRRL